MPENFEHLKPISQEQTHEVEKTLDLPELKPEEKIFLDTIISSVSYNKRVGEYQGYLNPEIIHTIAELNLKTALRIVHQEKEPRIEVLAQLATLAKKRPDSDIDFKGLFASIETLANKTHKNNYTHQQDSDYRPISIAKAAIELRESEPVLSDKLLQLSIDRAKPRNNQYGVLDGHEKQADFFIDLIEAYAQADPKKAEQLLGELKIKNGGRSIHVIVKKYLELGDKESAFRVAVDFGWIKDVALAGSTMTDSPEKIFEAVKKKFLTEKVKVGFYESDGYEIPVGSAIEVYTEIAERCLQTGKSGIAQRFLNEAKTLAETRGERRKYELFKIFAYSDPDAAINLIPETMKKNNYEKYQVIDDLAIKVALYNPNKAREFYQTTPNKYIWSGSFEKQDALITLISEFKRHGDDVNAESLLNELRINIDKYREYYDGWNITFDNIYKLSEFFPEVAMEIIESGRVRFPAMKIEANTDGVKNKDDIQRLFDIFERCGLSLEDQRAFFEKSNPNYSWGGSHLSKEGRENLNAFILNRIQNKNIKLLDETGFMSYFQSLDPENENDMVALKNLALAGLIPEYKIEDLLKKGDVQSLTFSSLLLSAEVYKKTDFDLASFDHLMSLAQQENPSARRAALQGIKLLQPKIAELFYSSNQQYQDALKKLFDLSPEAQQWFVNLDTYIAKNFDTQHLIRLVTKLSSVEANHMFPQAMEKAREEIIAHVQSDEDLADYYLENLHLYHNKPWVVQGLEGAVKHFPVAQKFIKAVDSGSAQWKDAPYVATVYAKAKLTKPHDEEWDEEYGGSETEGFVETDPYENHHWKFTGEQIIIAMALSDVLSGRADEESIKQLGLSSESLKILKSVEQQLSTAYENFLAEIESSSTFPEEDKNAFLHPENSSVPMTDLRDNIRSFVARYLIQMAEGDVAKLNKELGDISENLEGILQEGLRRFIKIYEVDVPLYDKLYEEFDNLRETGQYPLEVYLGRDGIYAWLGRRAQDIARRRKLGLEGRKQAKEAGEVIEIQPKYLIYPRYFRDSINYETKREFLEQEGISPDADPMFYDTGYTGTIPEQIMRVMDFENEEIERRIRLLSAPVMHRRVKGIPENARAEIIEYIEHNAKTENTAVGLIKDPETGKIRPIAEPTAPDEQFYFMMVKQAVGRHYWLKEKLHHEPSGNINLDSEHYLIRVRQEYSTLLPPKFVSDPKTYLAQHGELLKGSKGEGKYPDEEVVLFKLSDDTEIVAKRVELRKAKEARKEFSILIAARKANLPTAEPVGFLSGKTEADSSYLLMKKIEGISGRNFDKYLRDSGKFTEEKIKSILQQVAQKNREMAELFRTALKIDKRWRIKDTIIELNEETGEVESVIPIDWERAQNFNPATPKEIDEII